MRKFLLYSCAGLIATSPAYALTCLKDYGGCAKSSVAAGDCADLGYSTEDVDGCDKYLKCPFNINYKRCVQLNCKTLGYTTADKTSWCASDQIQTCPTDSNYTMCAEGKSCEDLGYTKDDKSSWCKTTQTCSTDSSYTMCSEGKNCAALGFQLKSDQSSWCAAFTDCPLNSNYGACTEVADTNGTTDTTDCSDYTLSECPSNAKCSACGIGTNIKYKVDSCTDGYVSWNSYCDYSCAAGYGTAQAYARAILGSYNTCSADTGVTPIVQCSTDCPDSSTSSISRGHYWDLGCLPKRNLTPRETRCLSTMRSALIWIKKHNNLCSNRQVDYLGTFENAGYYLNSLTDEFLQDRCAKCVGTSGCMEDESSDELLSTSR